MSGQCLAGRIPCQDRLRSTLSPWENRRSRERASVTWRFTVTKARASCNRLDDRARIVRTPVLSRRNARERCFEATSISRLPFTLTTHW
jgi:hypothetical protein